jgi:hypothetical protein
MNIDLKEMMCEDAEVERIQLAPDRYHWPYLSLDLFYDDVVSSFQWQDD